MDGASEHLIRFGQAKEEQQLIYDSTGRLLERISDALSSYSKTGIKKESFDENIALQRGIIESLKLDNMRKKMKVSFFGGTSSGKTTTVNALLGRELLPSGMGDTTGCFVQVERLHEHIGPTVNVEGGLSQSKSTGVKDSKVRPKETGCDGDETKVKSYFCFQKIERGEPEARLGLHEDQKQPLDEESLNRLVDVSSRTSLDSSYILKIYLHDNETTCTLLQHDLQLMDCPGITKCRELKEQVSSFCEDSDVHVFILNPKTIISPEEKDHFLEVGRRLPRPDVIVGFSQWDLSARERHPERVKARHIDAVYGLLVDLGTVTTREEAEERCFFFSGSEALDIALGERDYLLRGWEGRHATFQNFVFKIKEQVTLTGMRAKLENGRRTCGEVLSECAGLLHRLDEEVKHKKKQTTDNICDVEEKLSAFSQEYNEFVQEGEKLKIKAFEDIEKEVCRCLEEVCKTMGRTLKRSSLIDDFEEDRIHMFAEKAIKKWYQKILGELNRATQQVCENYSFSVLDSYKIHFKAFKHEIPSAYLLPFEIQEPSYSSTLPDSALRCLMTGISEHSLWASFASTRRRLNSVETDRERHALVRTLAAAAAVFFIHVRQWLRSSVESQLQRMTQDQTDAFICPDEIRKSCAESVAAFCNNSSEFYQRQVKDCVEKELTRHQDEEECMRNQLDAFSERITTLMRETEEIQEKL
ncbi:mitofusin-2-like [Diadema antillarum]|uniref:mitofusin-2-like n=1 Tax=Diadema antillarum TaxID=105358 RepID=UPI003A87B191